jgi:putative addiction module component (TIGR02574 family)
MNERVKRLTEEFSKLAPAEQDDLIDQLIVLRKPDPDIDKAWADEIDRRVRRYDSGQEPGIDSEEVLAQVRARLARRREA